MIFVDVSEDGITTAPDHEDRCNEDRLTAVRTVGRTNTP